MIRRYTVFAFAALILGHIRQASAIEVVTTFVGGEAPRNASGGGNLVDIFNEAAGRWGQAYPEPFTIRLYFGWAPTGAAGTHTLIEKGGEPARELAGLILFDNSGSVAFYLDPTPSGNDEYAHYTEEHQNLGGGLVNVARVFTHPTGDAVGRCDLLSVAMHEIGHALGMGIDNPGFPGQAAAGAIVIDNRFPYAGTSVPLAVNNSGTTTHFDPLALAYGSLMTGICADERRLPSALDILANAQISGFECFIPIRAESTQTITRSDPEDSARGFLR